MGIFGKKFLSQIVEFYDPHPVNYGAQRFGLAAPPKIAEVARDEINGKKMPIEDAVEKLMAVAGECEIITDTKGSSIKVRVFYDDTYHAESTFHIIKFR